MSQKRFCDVFAEGGAGMAVTIADVARKAGVTNGTVSRALNDYPDILPETKRRIMEAAQELGYVRNVSARNLSAKRPPNLALIISGMLEGNSKDNLMYLLLQGVLNYTTEHHLELALYALDPMKERQSYTEFCRLHSISGAIVSGVTVDDPYLMDLISSDIPSVAIDIPVGSDKAGWISIDNRAAACEAVETLLEIGHKDLLIVAGKKNADVNTVRMQGVQDALENEGMHLSDCPRLYCDFSEEIAYEKTLLYLKNKKKKRPTAIFCFSDIMALGVMRAVREVGLSIPQDISVMGFDGLHLCELTIPTLSTVHQDRREIGYEAAAMLHDIMEGRCRGGHRVLPYDVILRESVQEMNK